MWLSKFWSRVGSVLGVAPNHQNSPTTQGQVMLVMLGMLPTLRKTSPRKKPALVIIIKHRYRGRSSVLKGGAKCLAVPIRRLRLLLGVFGCEALSVSGALEVACAGWLLD